MASDSVKVHMRRETGEEEELNIVHAQNKPVSMNRLRQYRDELALARQRRQRKKLEESKVRIRNYVEPLAGEGLDISTWKGGGSSVRQDIIVPLRKRFAQYKGTGDWNPAQMIQPKQAEALPTETRVISDVGAKGLEAEWMPGPYGRAPIGGYTGIPMQKGVELPIQEVMVGAPWTGAPWTGLGSLSRLPTTDPTYDLDIVASKEIQEAGGVGLQLTVKSKKMGHMFFTYGFKFKDGTRWISTSDVVHVDPNTPTAMTLHLTTDQFQTLMAKAAQATGYALTVYVTQGVFGLRRKMIGQAVWGTY